MPVKPVVKPHEVFHYRLPSGKAEEYSTEALAVLKDVEAVNPGFLPLLLRADTVLTLSGVRSFGPYMSNPHKLFTEAEVTAVKEVLAKHNIYYVSDASVYTKNIIRGYMIINEPALGKIPDQYKVKGWLTLQAPYTLDCQAAWSYFQETNLRDDMLNGSLPRDWLSDPWAPRNIRFGVLLGYPGEAIASILPNDHYSGRVKRAKIAYHDKYAGAYPIYDFAAEITNHPNIVAHQKLWSDILTTLYESDWHQTVQTNPAFQATLAKLA